LRQKLIDILLSTGRQVIVLEGRPGVPENPAPKKNLVFKNHLSASETIVLLRESNIIISRSGYTTIMELLSIGKSALLIPTPGQTEQEYLARILSEKGWFHAISQKNLDEKSIDAFSTTIVPAGFMEESAILLENALAELLD
jgi:predicted glycosyltransferase